MTKFKAIPLVILISGCSITPTVQYQILQKNETSDSAFDSYFLPSSNIIITPNIEPIKKSENPEADIKATKSEDAVNSKKQKSGKVIKKAVTSVSSQSAKSYQDEGTVSSFTVTSIPTEYEDFKLAVIRSDPFYSDGNINVTKHENTALVKEIGTDTVDNRKAIIETAGSIVVNALKMGLASPDEIDLNDIQPIDVMELIKVKEDSSGAGIFDRGGRIDVSIQGIAITIHPIPPGAKAIKDLPQNSDTSHFFYSTCRTADIKIKYKGKFYNSSIKISDPKYFEAVEFPVKGKIVTHSSCGVSVTTDKTDGTANIKLVDALVAQAKAIKDTVDAAKK